MEQAGNTAADEADVAARPAPDFKETPDVDPYPRYERLRATCPVAQVTKDSGLRPFLITTYQDAKAALADPRLVKDPRAGSAALIAAGVAQVYLGGGPTLADNMLTADPPDHSRLRRLVSDQFTVRRTAALEPRIQELTDGLIDAFPADGRVEFMDAFANQLPALVIAELLGVPAEDRELFRTWSEHSLLSPSDPRQRVGAVALNDYVVELVAAKGTDSGGRDLISALMASASEDRLTEAELVGSIKLLIIAGHETTVNLLGNGLLALLGAPDQLDLLRARPELIAEAVEELLRFDSPVERATVRFAAHDMRIGGTLIPRGAVVYVVLGSANRDEAEYEQADRLDVTRAPRGHLAFGHSLHYCIGAPLARLEARIAFTTLLARLPEIELDVKPEQLTHRPSTIMRGLTALPIRFRAHNPAGAK